MMLSRLLMMMAVASSAATSSFVSQIVNLITPYVSIHDIIKFLAQFDTPSSAIGRRELQSAASSITLPSPLTSDNVKPEAYNGWLDASPHVTWGTLNSTISRRGDGKNVELSYVTARNESGQRGGVVISVGHTEPIEKYAEQIHDLLGQGFSPVYALDHRGQGRSTRLLPDDSFKSHVESRSDFIIDFRAFVTKADEEMTASGVTKRFMHCHSMGCTIAFAYMIEEHYAQRRTIFNAVAANAPLIKPVTSPIPYSVAVATGELMLRFNLDTYYTPTFGKTFDELYVDNTAWPDRQRIQTARCIARRDQMYRAGHIGLCLGDPTARLTYELFGMYDAFKFFLDVKAKLSTPILIQQAKDIGDGSDGVVINTEQTKFCSKGAHACKLTSYPTSEHNIWFEKDTIRSVALGEVYPWYDAHAGSVTPQSKLPPTCNWEWRWWCSIFGCDCIHDCDHPAARC